VSRTSELPGKSGLKVYISAMMAPIAKRSMGALYTCDRSSTSGARYLPGPWPTNHGRHAAKHNPIMPFQGGHTARTVANSGSALAHQEQGLHAVVLAAAQKDPPACGDVVGVRRTRPDLPCETEVRNLDQVLGDQQVLCNDGMLVSGIPLQLAKHVPCRQLTRLHVSMEVAMLVNVRQALENLVAPVLYPGLWKELVAVLHHLV
jgi:hypothetical protein